MRTDEVDMRQAIFEDALFDAYRALQAAMHIRSLNRDEVTRQCAQACGRLEFHLQDRNLALNDPWSKAA